MKRLVALSVAVIMIAGAVAIRGAIDGNDGNGRGAVAADGDFRLQCSTEVQDVCNKLAESDDGLAVNIEPAGVTTDRLKALRASDDPGFDAWLNAGPWSEILSENRGFAKITGSPLGAPSDVLARSPVVIVLPGGRQSPVTADCGETITWRCLVDPSQDVPIKIGVPGPDNGDGLAVISSAVTDYFDSGGYSLSDFESSDFSTWFDLLTAPPAAGLGGRPPVVVAISVPGAFQAAGGLEAQVAALLANYPKSAVVYPSPIVTADVHLVPRADLRSDEALKRVDGSRLSELLAKAGWRVEGQPVVSGINGAEKLPVKSNLADPDILQALRDRW